MSQVPKGGRFRDSKRRIDDLIAAVDDALEQQIPSAGGSTLDDGRLAQVLRAKKREHGSVFNEVRATISFDDDHLRELGVDTTPSRKTMELRVPRGVHESAPLLGDTDASMLDLLDMPSHHRTSTRRWASFVCFTIVCCVVCAPASTLSWPALEPILKREGVFGPSASSSSVSADDERYQQESLSNVLSLAAGFNVMAYLPIGILYDAMGPRVTGIIGSLCAGCGLALMSFGVTERGLNWLLYFAYPLSICGGACVSYGLYAWLWLLPSSSQNLVNSINSAAMAVSGLLVFVLIFAQHSDATITSGSFFSLCAILAILAATISALFLPNRAQINKYSAVVLSQDLDAPSSRQITLTQTLKMTRQVWKRNSMSNWIFALWLVFANLSIFLPTLDQLFFYRVLLGHDAAGRLVNSYALVGGVVGAIGSVFVGKLLDIMDKRLFFGVLNLLVVVSTVLHLLPSLGAQLLFQVTSVLCLIMAIIFGARYAMMYAPPELFGTFCGVMLSFMGLAQMIFPPIISKIVMVFPENSVVRYSSTYIFFIASTVAIAVVLLFYWRTHPMPTVGSVTPSGGAG